MISENLHTVISRIKECALQCGRVPDEIQLVAVSKRFPANAVWEAYNAGQTVFGENYIQELQGKHPDLPPAARFHFIGHLQSNKAKAAAELCSMIETVDRLKLAEALNRHLTALNRKMDILIQVNIGKDQKKSGTTAAEAEVLLRQIQELDMLCPVGLMTMPPFTEDPEESRPYFRDLKTLAMEFQSKQLFSDRKTIELSMGMTNDYHVAIEEGATLVRIGTAIFGQRTPKQ